MQSVLVAFFVDLSFWFLWYPEISWLAEVRESQSQSPLSISSKRGNIYTEITLIATVISSDKNRQNIENTLYLVFSKAYVEFYIYYNIWNKTFTKMYKYISFSSKFNKTWK